MGGVGDWRRIEDGIPWSVHAVHVIGGLSIIYLLITVDMVILNKKYPSFITTDADMCRYIILVLLLLLIR